MGDYNKSCGIVFLKVTLTLHETQTELKRNELKKSIHKILVPTNLYFSYDFFQYF
jgi:hypothetical protein